MLSPEEVALLRERMKEWDARSRLGTSDLADVVDVLLATGCRTGEVLAIRWKDLDLTSDIPSVNIVGTIVDLPGAGLVRRRHHDPGRTRHRRRVAPTRPLVEPGDQGALRQARPRGTGPHRRVSAADRLNRRTFIGRNEASQ